METKSIFKSRVFWLAVIQGTIGIVAVFESAHPGVGWIVIAKSVLDIMARYATTQPVSTTGSIIN